MIYLKWSWLEITTRSHFKKSYKNISAVVKTGLGQTSVRVVAVLFCRHTAGRYVVDADTNIFKNHT